MPVGTAVAGQAGVHQPQAVEQLRPRTEGAADPRHAGPLVEGQAAGTYSTSSTSARAAWVIRLLV